MHALQLLERAMRQRAVGATASNEQSSRSHMVFMLHLAGLNEASGQRVSGATLAYDLGHDLLHQVIAADAGNTFRQISAHGHVASYISMGCRLGCCQSELCALPVLALVRF